MLISLPFPISLYQAWKRQNHTGYQYKSKEYLDYLQQVWNELSRGRFIIRNNQTYAIEIFLHSSTWLTQKNTLRKKDLDNYLKVILDAIVKYCELNGYTFDDSYIVELMVKKVYDKTQERAVIRFTECSFP